MSRSVLGGVLAAAVFLVAPVTPASAVVYTVTFAGTASDNFVQTTDAAGAFQQQDFTGGVFSAVFQFDTALLPANAPDTGVGETFRYALDGGWFTSTVTFTGGVAPSFSGPAVLNSLRGAFGPGGYLELQDDRLVRDDAAATENATLFIGGFDGLDAVPGTDFPDFLTAQNPSFTLSSSLLNQDGSSRYVYAYGAIDSVSVATAAAVPEPATWATMALGFGLLGAAARRRKSLVAA